MYACEINYLSEKVALLDPIFTTKIDVNIVRDKYEYYHYSEFIKRLEIMAFVVFEVERI